VSLDPVWYRVHAFVPMHIGACVDKMATTEPARIRDVPQTLRQKDDTWAGAPRSRRVGRQRLCRERV